MNLDELKRLIGEATPGPTDEVQFTANIDCDESEAYSVKLGLAVRWADGLPLSIGRLHPGASEEFGNLRHDCVA